MYRRLVIGEVSLAGSRWGAGEGAYGQPTRTMVANHLDDVSDVIAAAEHAAVSGSWVVGFVSYDAAPALDRTLRVPGSPELPLVWFAVFSEPPHQSYQDRGDFELGPWMAGLPEAEHSSQVASIRNSIAAGDTYQANLTFAMKASFQGSLFGLLEAMRQAQPRSFGTLIDLGEAQIVSVSPELFLKKRGRRIVTMPMKGTAPRGRSSAEDGSIRRGLVESEKERAGNMMIVDMLRNDLGRISVPGSIEVPALFQAEQYPTVWQLTSTIQGTERPGVTLLDLFRATFPSGSVTGAPKSSTMGIIADLERDPRGPYCGAIGYLAPGGEDAMFSVAIRTGVVSGGTFSYHVGGGITYDSLAGYEYQECLWKALVVTEGFDPPALLETMLWQPDIGIELLDRHISRLAASAAYWSIPFDPAPVGEALSAVGGSRTQKVRLILNPDGEVELETMPSGSKDDPVQLKVWPERVDGGDSHMAHKTADRSRYPETEEEFEWVLLNVDGCVTETNISNLFIRQGDKWYTPPVEDGCLPGVYRSKVLDEGRAVEKSLTVEDVVSSDELALTNAVRGWRKAALIE